MDTIEVVDGFPVELPIRQKGNSIYELRLGTTNDKPLTFSQVTQYLEENFKTKEMEEYDVKVSVEFSTIGWRNLTKWMNPTTFDTLKLFEDYDEQLDKENMAFYQFAVHFVQRAGYEADKGGNDEHNDCLYNAIKKAYPFGWIIDIRTRKRISAEQFKKRLGLNRDDAVPVSIVSKAETMLRTTIHVVGDHTYTSSQTFTQTITVKLRKGHYTYVRPSSVQGLDAGRPMKVRKMITSVREDANSYRIYDGKKQRKVASILFHKTYLGAASRYWSIPTTSRDELESVWNTTFEENEALKESSKGFLDMSKWQGRYHDVSSYLFENYASLFEAEPIGLQESEWIRKASGGGLNWANNDTHIEKAFQYDINSYYPSLMASPMAIPVKAGIFQTLDTDPERWAYGIYRVSMSDLNPRLVMKRKNEYYTSTEIQRAIETGATVKLIVDGKTNALLYPSKTIVKSSFVFKKMVDRMYVRKETNTKMAKRILNNLWGALCERVREVKYKRLGDKPIDCQRVESVYEVQPNQYRCEYVPDDVPSLYKTCWGRLGVFLTARGRVLLSKTIEPHLDNIHYVNTDGFVSDTEIPLELSAKLGEWKMEYDGVPCYIKHCKKKTFE